MENENFESNKIAGVSDIEDYKFDYNFMNMPWDDRSNKSKLGAITLLVTIFGATMALAINNLIIHYRGFYSQSLHSNTEIDCNVAKYDTYPYVARINLVSSNELICLGAIVSKSSVLANELCIKSGPVRLRTGSFIDPRCKKGFAVDLLETIPHDGVVTKNLVLLTTFENIGDCMQVIKIGIKLNMKKQFYIIGRPYRGGRVLSFQLANYYEQRNTSLETAYSFNKNKTIAVRTFGKCPVRAGDLLVQSGRLYGLASTSVSRKEDFKTVFFANISVVINELKALEVNFFE